MQLPPEDLEDLVRALRGEAAKRLGEAFRGRDLLGLDEDELGRAEAALLEICEKEDRGRALSGGAAFGADGQKQLAERLCDEIFGLGVLQPYTDDREPDVEEVSVNQATKGTLVRSGNRRERFDPRFRSDVEFRDYAQRQVARAGGRLDEASPWASVRLASGCRLTAVLPPISSSPRLTIRVPRIRAHSVEDLVALGTVEPELSRFLEAAVRGRLTILVSGGTFSGKTTTLRALCGAVPALERLVTIEQDPELMLEGDVPAECVDLSTRLPNIEGVGEVRMRQLVKVALRLRPDRIVVGEVMGEEAIDMLTAMNSGHEGSMCTVHADSARRALHKLVQCAMQSPEHWTVEVIRELIADSIDLVVHMHHDEVSGRRHVAEVAEVAGMEEGLVLTNILFQRRDGRLLRSPVRPRKAERLEEAGWRG